MSTRVLVVDDEKLIVKGIKFSLLQDGMIVDSAHDGEEAYNLFTENQYDIVILDIMLPKKNGYEVCQLMREVSDIPILMLTAKDSDMDKILGLEYGADDYLTKPFNILELKARMKAVLRRMKSKSLAQEVSKTESDNYIEVRGLRLDTKSRRVFIHGVEVYLTAKEFDLLELLIVNKDKVYSRGELLSEVWKGASGDERTVDVHVRRLREKIEKQPSEPNYIFTKWGVGYYFKGI